MQPGFKFCNLCFIFAPWGFLLPTSFQEWDGSKEPTGASCQHPLSGGRRFWDEGHQLLSTSGLLTVSLLPSVKTATFGPLGESTAAQVP